MIAGPGDNRAAAGRRGNGRLRVSRGDREQAIELLKAAFVEDRLTKEELDARVGRALASRTRADLAVVTADITAGPNAGQTAGPNAGQRHGPARAWGGPPIGNAAKAGTAVGVATAVAVVLAFATSIPPAFLFIVSFFFTGLLAAAWMLFSREEERSRSRLPIQPDPGRPAKPPLEAG